MEWLTVGQICKMTNLAESTVRRYLWRLEDFVQYTEFDHVTKYNSNCVNVLIRAAELYKQRKTTEEVKNILEEEGFSKVVNVVVEEDSHHPTTNSQAPVQREMQELKGYIQNLTKKIDSLENKLEHQQKQLDEKLEKRDQELMQAIRQLQEEKKSKLRWWKKIFSRR